MLITDLLLLLSLSAGDDKDNLLAVRIKEGDTSAFETFYNRHQGRLLSFLISKGLSEQGAEDLLQQAFLTIWEKRSEIKPGRSLKSFLFTIAYNRMLNHFRDQKNAEPHYAFHLADGGQNPEEKTETSLAIRDLHQAVKALPEKRRRVFELCYLEEFTYREAAEVLGVSAKTIENHMAIALKEIREALKKYFPGD